MTPDLNTKAQIRRAMRQRLEAVSLAQRQEWSALISVRLLALPELASARSVFCFISTGYEPDTRLLIESLLQEGKTVSVPRIGDDGLMMACRISTLDSCTSGKWGIPEPHQELPSLVDSVSPDVVIVPGIAFTPRGQRLGRGGGHYDRYLQAHPTPGNLAIAPAFEIQILDELPVDPHDQRVNLIVTESRLIHAK